MINPDLSNFRIMFSDSFFPELLTKKYDTFLFHKNYPFKTLKGYFYETIQNLDIPGINLQTLLVSALNNAGLTGSDFSSKNHPTINKIFPGTAPINEIIDGTSVNITFRNTLINYLYCYEVLYSYYARKRTMDDFRITLTMMDSSELPILKFDLSECFISQMPGLSFSYVQKFNETKTFDIGFTFSKFDVSLIIPDFNIVQTNLQ